MWRHDFTAMRCPTLKDLPLLPEGKAGWLLTEESPQLSDIAPNGQPWPKISIVIPWLFTLVDNILRWLGRFSNIYNNDPHSSLS